MSMLQIPPASNLTLHEVKQKFNPRNELAEAVGILRALSQAQSAASAA